MAESTEAGDHSEPSKEIHTGGGAYIGDNVNTGGGDFVGRDKIVHQHYHHPPIGPPFQAPSLPAHFVPRPEVSDELKTHLLAKQTTEPGALVISAVHGLGGIGKTTLVARLAHDAEIRKRFPDGVLWATLGQEPKVLSRLHDWIQALGDRTFHSTTVDGASAQLRTLLHGKACLLVVDDAWQADQARPFLVGGERCRVLITTRDAGLARKVGARLYDLEVMTEAQALALFEARLGPLDGHREQAASLARELGYLPLALELAAAQVDAGDTWDELLDAFRQGLVDLAAMDLDEATRRNESLRLSFRMSLERLSPDDQEAFAWLGVLPDDARLNPAMAATLWDQAETDARRRLRRLRDKALLKAVGDHTYVIHDLLHDEASLRLAEGMPPPEAHAALLARYQARSERAQWHTLPQDGYIQAYLTWHMEKAGWEDQIHALLSEETDGGRNGWYEAPDPSDRAGAYVADVNRAWRLAEERFSRAPSASTLALQCRYGLISASLNSLAERTPPFLLSVLVGKGVWRPSKGLLYARQAPDPRQRAEALVAMAPHLPQAPLLEALDEAREIELEDWKVIALTGLAPYLPEPVRTQVVEEALLAAQDLPEEWMDESPRAEALAQLAAHLPENLLLETWALAQEMQDDDWRAWLLARLVPHLPETKREPAFREALDAVRKIAWKPLQAAALAALAPCLPEPERGPVFREALDAVRRIKWEPQQADSAAMLASQVPADLLREALAVIRALGDEYARAHALSGLAPRLREAEDLVPEALTTAETIKSPNQRARVWAALVPHLPGPERTQRLREALTAADAIEYDGLREEALADLAPHLPEGLVREALAIVRRIEDEDMQVWAMAGLASGLAEEQLGNLWAAAQAIQGESLRAEALIDLAPHLPESVEPEPWHIVLAAVLSLEEESQKVSMLTTLTPRLPETLLQEVLVAAQEIGWEPEQAQALAGLAPHLSDALLQEAWTAAQEIQDDRRTWTLAKLVAHLPQPDRDVELRKALAAARGIEYNEELRAGALAALAPCLPEPEREQVIGEALEAAQEILDTFFFDDDAQAEALADLAPHLPAAYVRAAVHKASDIQDSNWRGWALAKLVPHLPASERDRALPKTLMAACSIDNTWNRSQALTELARHLAALPDSVRTRLWLEKDEGVNLLRSLARRTRQDLASDLRALQPVIASLGGDEAITEVFRAIQDVGRWWP